MRRPWALPLVPLYVAGSAVRWAGVRPKRLEHGVVSVGSLSAGGAGKTPFVIALARLLTERGWSVDVLSRGFGRQGEGVARVAVDGNAEQFGDEPLLIARETGVPVYVGALRRRAGELAEREASAAHGKQRVHLLDDGFQHRQLYREVDIVLVGGADLEDWLLPAGNRREPLSALSRASVFAVEEGDESEHGVIERLRRSGRMQPVCLYRREMVVPDVSGPVLAFCGIARPGQFFAGLERAGVGVAARRSFPDHHWYREGDLSALRRAAAECGVSAMVTTAKDAVRLGNQAEGLGMPLLVADLSVDFVNEQAMFESLLGGLVERAVDAAFRRSTGMSSEAKLRGWENLRAKTKAEE